MDLPPDRNPIEGKPGPTRRHDQDGAAGIHCQLLKQSLGPTAFSRRPANHGKIMRASRPQEAIDIGAVRAGYPVRRYLADCDRLRYLNDASGGAEVPYMCPRFRLRIFAAWKCLPQGDVESASAGKFDMAIEIRDLYRRKRNVDEIEMRLERNRHSIGGFENGVIGIGSTDGDEKRLHDSTH